MVAEKKILNELVTELSEVVNASTVQTYEDDTTPSGIAVERKKYKPKGEIHFNDYFIDLCFDCIEDDLLLRILPFMHKYKAYFRLHPEKGHDTFCLRISTYSKGLTGGVVLYRPTKELIINCD